MQIYEAPKGKQFRLKGNIVNVPVDICTTVSTLPRPQNENDTIQVKLKRRMRYENHVLAQNIRPQKVKEAVE